MPEKLMPLKITSQAVEIAALRDLRERMMRDIEAVMFGGYQPAPPTTLRLGGDRCPQCGPVLACARHMVCV